MKISEFRKLIKEEVRNVIKEASATSLEYYLLTGYPKETLQALSKHINANNIKPKFEPSFHAGGPMYGKKIHSLRFMADKDFIQILGKYPNLKAPFDKLLVQYNVDKPKAPKTFSNSEASDVEDYFSDYDVELTTNFNLEKFAKYIKMSKEDAKQVLVNLEDDKVMKNIAKGNYTTFDVFNPYIFNDEYDQMMDDLGLQPG
jgi:hypothetical protein